jgi:arylformamidase
MLVDITYGLNNGMKKYPSDPSPSILKTNATKKQEIETILDESGLSSGAGVEKSKYLSGYTTCTIRSHHGTHIDAPAHKLHDGKTIDQYPLAKFANIVGIVDMTQQKIYKRMTSEIKREDLQIARLINVARNTRAILFYTGFIDYLNGGQSEDEQKFPFFNQETISQIMTLFPELNIIGIDSFSFDPRGSNSEVHRAMFEKDILPLETICNMSDIKHAQQEKPLATKTLYCFPILINGSDAAQTRAVVEFK